MLAPTPGPRVGRELIPAPLPSVSLYVHIPFCSSRCNYCDFYFETTRSPRVIEATLDRILEEAAFFVESIGGPQLRSVYFGGGTPSIVPPTLLDRFLTRLQSVLFQTPSRREERMEWTFEANPESLTDELLETLTRHGINRISLGVQSFDDRLLRSLTRRADRATVLAALQALSAERYRQLRLNVDFITGIPGQTEEMVRSDVKRALDFGTEHFSVYSLTVEEHTPLKQAVDIKVRRMPAPERQDGLWLAARDAIIAAGFEWYEISNFALPGCRSEHNLGYWRLDPYVGLGPGGVSTIPMMHHDQTLPSAVRLTNPNLFVYGSRCDRGWHHEPEVLDAPTLLFEHFITGLRTTDGLSLHRLKAIFGRDLQRLWEPRLAEWIEGGIADAEALEANEPRLQLTAAGRLALDRHLLEIGGWIEALGELPPPRWPLPRSPL